MAAPSLSMRQETLPIARARSTSRTRTHVSRPTTPLRAPSRSSHRNSTTTPTISTPGGTIPDPSASHPLNGLETAFADLSDGMADLEAHFLNLQVLNESVARFNENFASLLYGLNMSAFCVDFSEAPGPESFKRAAEQGRGLRSGLVGVESGDGGDGTRQKSVPGAAMGMAWENAGGYGAADKPSALDVDATFLTTDTSFVENPPASVQPARYTNHSTVGPASHGRVPTGAAGRARERGRGAASSATSTRGRGAINARGGRGSARGTSSDRARGLRQR